MQAGDNGKRMRRFLDPFRFLLIAVAGWMNQAQEQMIDYLREENRVLREQTGERPLRLTDDQRRRLAAKAKGLSRKQFGPPHTDVHLDGAKSAPPTSQGRLGFPTLRGLKMGSLCRSDAEQDA